MSDRRRAEREHPTLQQLGFRTKDCRAKDVQSKLITHRSTNRATPLERCGVFRPNPRAAQLLERIGHLVCAEATKPSSGETESAAAPIIVRVHSPWNYTRARQQLFVDDSHASAWSLSSSLTSDCFYIQAFKAKRGWRDPTDCTACDRTLRSESAHPVETRPPMRNALTPSAPSLADWSERVTVASHRVRASVQATSPLPRPRRRQSAAAAAVVRALLLHDLLRVCRPLSTTPASTKACGALFRSGTHCAVSGFKLEEGDRTPDSVTGLVDGGWERRQMDRRSLTL